MANTWGSQTWSFNQWNDLDNVSFSVTGISISSNLGDETTAGEINLVGVDKIGVLKVGELKGHYKQQVIL